MADLSGVIDNYFTVASETFTDNLSSSISAGAVTVPVNNNSEYTNGDCVVLTVDPGTVNEATFIGKKSGLNFIECIWTEGNTAVGHSNGATIIDYDSATHHSAQSKGIQQFANDDGTLKTQPVRDALGLGTSAVNGWEVFPYTVSVTSGYSSGEGLFSMTVSNADVTDEISAGMNFRLQRATSPSTQCTDLESSSSQFWSDSSLTGLTQTDDITVEAWVNLESYKSQAVVTQRTGSNGWDFWIDSNGYIRIHGNLSAGNYKLWNSAIQVPIGYWTHLAGTMDMSGNAAFIYFNGVSVPLVAAHSGVAASMTSATTLYIGNDTSNNYFDGKIADVRIWNIVRTQLQIRDNMYQALTGSETNLVGYWKFNGNGNDSTTNANNLTASGGATATTVDHPHRTTEYMKVISTSYGAPHTTIVVQTDIGRGIPNQTLSAPYYSTQAAPYGLPLPKFFGRGQVSGSNINVSESTASATLVDLTTYGPVASVWVGPSGKVEIAVSALIKASIANFAHTTLVRDGTDLGSNYGFSAVNINESTGAKITTFTGMSQGWHTFVLKYLAAGGATGTFSARAMSLKSIDNGDL